MSGRVVHCRQAPYDRYVGRGAGDLGEWGNLYSHRPSRVPGVIVVATVGEAIRLHRRWLWEQLRTGAIPLERMAELDGLTLGCWCHQPGPCHGHTLLAAARWAAAQLRSRSAAPSDPDSGPARSAAPEFVSGDLFESGCSTLVNAINCRGVMGAGIAREFRRRWPSMYEDYRRRCERGAVTLGRPYPWPASPARVINFPTKDDWREPSRLQAISEGVAHLRRHYRAWGIESLALPALGCGLGGLPWERVRPVFERGLADLAIPVLVFAPRA